MSIDAYFYVLENDDFAQLQSLFNELPKPPTGGKIFGVALPPESAKQIELLATPQSAIWEFLDEHGEVPYEFEWSGYTIYQLLHYLKEQGADLTASKLESAGPGWEWFAFDSDAKKKYLDRLDSSGFSPDELERWFAKFSNGEPVDEILDGLDILYDYFELIDESHVVLLNVG